VCVEIRPPVATIADLKRTEMRFRLASVADAEALGALNAQLIRDEGHRNPMTVGQLVERMNGWLQREYEALIVEDDGKVVGYALFRREPEDIYLRQIFVRPDDRRRGIGRAMIEWLMQNAWQSAARVRIEVLVGNATAREFWHALGFRDYCITMEVDFSRRA
jgi:ribosomal protein S18 acetylase RimI-like enzyme